MLWRLKKRWGMKKTYLTKEDIMKDVMRLYKPGNQLGVYMSFEYRGRVHIDPRGLCGSDTGFSGGRYLKVLCFRRACAGHWEYAGKHRRALHDGRNCL